jgi:hypothetical protein
MKKSSKPQQLSFQSRLESISDELEYYALPVPEKISRALGTRGPVPVMAKVNDSKPFLISLYPVGGGRHYIRVKAEVRKATQIKEGDRVRVEITVRDRSAEISVPKDLMSALKAEGVLEEFNALPAGQKSFMLRKIDEAAKPETREKRIQAAVEAAHKKRERQLDRRVSGS